MFTTLGREFPAMHFQINMWLPARWNAASPDGYLGLGGAFPPKNWAEHAEFVHALAAWLVETCGLAPERLSFSFVNEPNLTPFFVGSDADLLLLADVTRRALDAVSPQIRLAGLDEVHGVTLTQALAPRLKPDCCDLWTFHVYEKGAPALTAALRDRVAALRPLGPVWVTEFADTTFGSPDAEMDFSSPEAALSFASALTQLWPSGVTGIVHFRLADSYVTGSALAQALKAATNAGGWAGHGLFADARGSQGHAPFEIFPAFWVFAHFNTQMAGGTALPTRGGAPLLAAAARHTAPSGPRLTVLLVNPSTTTVAAQLDVANLGLTTARLVSGDWLSAAAGTDLGTVGASNGTLRLNVSLPPQSARWLTVAALAAPTATATPTFAAATTTAPGTPPAATVTPRPTGLVTLPPHATRTYLPLLGGGR
jgi:hypothetical protein